MDWQGQKIAEQMMQIMLLAFAVVGLTVGYMALSFKLMTVVYGVGVVLTALVTIPSWPFFNRHPLKWFDPAEAEKLLTKKPSKKSVTFDLSVRKST